MWTERNNVLEMKKQDLLKTFDELYFEVKSREGVVGLPRLHYKDSFDDFWILMQPFANEDRMSERGYKVSCTLNNQQCYRLNTCSYTPSDEIGWAMLIAANAPKGATIESFFTED